MGVPGRVDCGVPPTDGGSFGSGFRTFGVPGLSGVVPVDGGSFGLGRRVGVVGRSGVVPTDGG